jgi:hypothetical protein
MGPLPLELLVDEDVELDVLLELLVDEDVELDVLLELLVDEDVPVELLELLVDEDEDVDVLLELLVDEDVDAPPVPLELDDELAAPPAPLELDDELAAPPVDIAPPPPPSFGVHAPANAPRMNMVKMAPVDARTRLMTLLCMVWFPVQGDAQRLATRPIMLPSDQ